jgi:single-strand DNA-binding protein
MKLKKEKNKMLNQVVIVGRITNAPVEMKKDGKKFAIFTLACQRGYKNEEGEYETDFLEFFAYGNIVDGLKEYCKRGDVIGVRGMVQSIITDDNERILRLVADKITFLSATKKQKGEK